MASTKFFRDVYRISQKDISDMFGIPLATVKNWDARNCMPDYVFKMMEYQLNLNTLAKRAVDSLSSGNIKMFKEHEGMLVAVAYNYAGYDFNTDSGRYEKI